MVNVWLNYLPGWEQTDERMKREAYFKEHLVGHVNPHISTALIQDVEMCLVGLSWEEGGEKKKKKKKICQFPLWATSKQLPHLSQASIMHQSIPKKLSAEQIQENSGMCLNYGSLIHSCYNRTCGSVCRVITYDDEVGCKKVSHSISGFCQETR